MLTQSEIDQYQEAGYVIPSAFRLESRELERLTGGVQSVLDDNPDVPPDRLINCHLDAAPPYGVNGYGGFGDLARDPRILDMVQQLLGPDLILWSTHLFCKPGEKGREVPWHQDGQYWPIRPLATCTAWVALDKVDIGNGAMKVLPGSHRKGDYRHFQDDSPDLTLNQVIDPEQYDEADAVHLELEPGQLSLHDVHLVHGSAANTSGRRRAGLALRYMPASASFRRDLPIGGAKFDWATIPIELVRGRAIDETNDFRAGHPA